MHFPSCPEWTESRIELSSDRTLRLKGYIASLEQACLLLLVFESCVKESWNGVFEAWSYVTVTEVTPHVQYWWVWLRFERAAMVYHNLKGKWFWSIAWNFWLKHSDSPDQRNKGLQGRSFKFTVLKSPLINPCRPLQTSGPSSSKNQPPSAPRSERKMCTHDTTILQNYYTSTCWGRPPISVR